MEDIFDVSIIDVDGVPVVKAAGEIDVSTSRALRDQLNSVPDDAERIVIDLSDVTFLDSTALGVLVTTHMRLHDSATQGCVRLVVTRPHILKVLEVTGLTPVFEVFPTLDEAMAK